MLAAADFLIGQPSDSTAIHYAEGDDQNEQHGAEGGLYFCSPAEPEYFFDQVVAWWEEADAEEEAD